MTRFKSKRLLSLLLVLMLVFSMLIVSASAIESDSVIEGLEATAETEEETHIHTDTDDDTHSSESDEPSAANEQGRAALPPCGISNCTCTGACSWVPRDYRTPPESVNYHVYTKYCTGCGKTDGSIGVEVHNHNSNGICVQCGHVKTCTHPITTTNWITNCRWERYCAHCGVFVASGITHGPYTNGNWHYYSATQHIRSYTCSFGDSETYYQVADHTATKQYAPFDADRHSVSSYCSTCSSFIGSPTYEDHIDSNGDGICDGCGYETARFSVTVPAALTLTVSEWGKVYAASNAAIVNNSSAAVRVTNIIVSSENGWTLVPYGRNPASHKVDTKLIGFAVNGAATTQNASSETLLLPGTWIIDPAGSLPLAYDAVISATSRVIRSEQILTVVFVLEWA